MSLMRKLPVATLVVSGALLIMPLSGQAQATVKEWRVVTFSGTPAFLGLIQVASTLHHLKLFIEWEYADGRSHTDIWQWSDTLSAGDLIPIKAELKHLYPFSRLVGVKRYWLEWKSGPYPDYPDYRALVITGCQEGKYETVVVSAANAGTKGSYAVVMALIRNPRGDLVNVVWSKGFWIDKGETRNVSMYCRLADRPGYYYETWGSCQCFVYSTQSGWYGSNWR